MDHLANEKLQQDITELVKEHLSNLSKAVDLPNLEHVNVSPSLLQSVFVIRDYCFGYDAPLDKDIYQQVQDHISKIYEFLMLINYPTNSIGFKNSPLSQLLEQATSWCSAFDDTNTECDETVWKMIEPVIPDTLQKVGLNLYEALWWKSPPYMDIEILKRSEGIIIIQTPYEVDNYPGSIGVRFATVVAN